MRELLPDPSDSVDLVAAYLPPPGSGEDRPFVRCNMISTLDGAISVGGRSGGLGGAPDRRVFTALRALADVILVGAGTVRSEAYGPARLPDELREQRLTRGQPAVPPIAVVTRTANLDWSSPFFTEAEERPLVLTVDAADAGARRRGAEVAEVVPAGGERVEPKLALGRLRERGHRSVLLEGGPALNADVARAGLLDELCLTLTPRLVAGEGPRVFAGDELPEPLDLDVVHLLEEDGFFFYRLSLPVRPAGGVVNRRAPRVRR